MQVCECGLIQSICRRILYQRSSLTFLEYRTRIKFLKSQFNQLRSCVSLYVDAWIILLIAEENLTHSTNVENKENY